MPGTSNGWLTVNRVVKFHSSLWITAGATKTSTKMKQHTAMAAFLVIKRIHRPPKFRKTLYGRCMQMELRRNWNSPKCMEGVQLAGSELWVSQCFLPGG